MTTPFTFMKQNMMVSITCITYNHEKYIKDAIEGFLMQKVDFPIEIIIHDDASTDRTADIIREYEKKYPDIIKPIYQKENQFSKEGARRIYRDFVWNKVKGKYIAICEGDDFWTDVYKLQRQVDYMEQNPDCSLCVHSAYIYKDGKKSRIHQSAFDNKIFTVEEIIQGGNGGGGLFPTSSMLYPAVLMDNLPDFLKIAPTGDYPLTIFLSLRGKVYYIDKPMSVYRVGVVNSWSSKRREWSIEKQVDYSNKVINLLMEINQYTKYKYDTVIKKVIHQKQFTILLKQKKYREAKLKYPENYLNLDTKNKAKILIKQYFPGIANFLGKLKRKYRLRKMF